MTIQSKANQNVLKVGPVQLENVVKMNTGTNVVLLLVVAAMISVVHLAESMEPAGNRGALSLLTNPNRGQSNHLGRFLIGVFNSHAYDKFKFKTLKQSAAKM